MKRGAPRHPKMLALAEALDLEKWAAAGLMECLWHFAMDYAPRGDIGRHGNRVIADAIGWRGAPDFLVAALVGVGWFDGCLCHRLRLHDWPDHADNGVRGKEQVKKSGFLECYGTPPLPIPVPSEQVAPNQTDGLSRASGVPETESMKPSATPDLVAVAVAVPSLTKPIGRTTAANGAAGKPRPWSKEFADDWIQQHNGPPIPRYFKHLEPLVKSKGWDRVRPVVRHYIAVTLPEHVDFAKFVSAFGSWEERQQGRHPPTASNQRAQEREDRMTAGIMASLKGDGTVPMGGGDDGQGMAGRLGDSGSMHALPGVHDERDRPA